MSNDEVSKMYYEIDSSFRGKRYNGKEGKLSAKSAS